MPAPELEAAELHLRAALELRLRALGAEHEGRAQSLIGMGVMFRERGDLDGALLHTERGIVEYRRLPGDLRWELGAALGNLAGILMYKGEYDWAEVAARVARPLPQDRRRDSRISPAR